MTNQLELLLRRAGRDLANWQVCTFFKVPEEMQQTPCDFFGYTATGRAILIEAKSVHRLSLPIGKEPGIAIHQWNALREANRAGAISLIVWGRSHECAALSFDVAEHLAEDRKSIPWDKIDARYKHPIVGDSRVHLRMLEPWLAIGHGALVYE